MKFKNINLEPIVYDDEHTAFETTPDDWDPYETKLMLDDYDWMNYKLTAHLPTKEYGKMRVRFEYSGMGKCTMQVSGSKGYKKDNDVFKNYVHYICYKRAYEFDSELFQKHIIKFMEAHIRNWGEEYAFRGTKEAVEFYNAVLTDPNTTLIEKKSWTKK